MRLPDPSVGLAKFQEAHDAGILELKKIDENVFLYVDAPRSGGVRFTYVKMDGDIATAMAAVVPIGLIAGIPRVQVGYSVHLAHRGKGLATELVKAAIADFRLAAAREGVQRFYVEAIVGRDNKASIRVAEKSISEKRKQITDRDTGEPALQFFGLWRHLGARIPLNPAPAIFPIRLTTSAWPAGSRAPAPQPQHPLTPSLAFYRPRRPLQSTSLVSTGVEL